MTVERETSLRRVLAVLRDPALAEHNPGARQPGYMPPCGPDVLYLKIGGSFIAYFRHGDVAEAHGCLLPADRGPHTTAVIREQFEHLFAQGVKKIVGVPRNARAQAKARAVGMRDTGERAGGYPIYEVAR